MEKSINPALVATDSKSARRRYPEKRAEGEDPFLDDYCRVIYGASFRRLAYKPGVWLFPDNSHLGTRITHSLETSALAEKIGQRLGLNASLCRAIGIGHDLGHSSFGHQGERVISKLSGRKFQQEVLSVLAAQHIDRLNLSRQILVGILWSDVIAKEMPWFQKENLLSEITPEAEVSKLSDKVSYTISDIDDCLKRRVPATNIRDIPELMRLVALMGKNKGERLQRCEDALCEESLKKGFVSFSDSETAKIFWEAKELMTKHFYKSPAANPDFVEEMLTKAHQTLSRSKMAGKADLWLLLYMASGYEIRLLADCQENPDDLISRLSANELFSALEGKEINVENPDMNW